MPFLLHLVGEQPMPVLLPDRFLRPERSLLVCTTKTRPVAERLQRLLPHAAIEETDPYDLPAILARLHSLAPADQPAVVNLTGGTKMMMLAAFALAMQRGWECVYLESEHRPATLHRYTTRGGLKRQAQDKLPTLITAADYLNAHLPGFRAEGFSRDDDGYLTDGGVFEEAVYRALQPHVDEVLAGVRPEGVADQIEMDLVIRVGNQVGVAEIKLGGREERPKQGIDQLSTAAGREYLGTYTARFLVTANPLGRSVLQLAKEKQVTVVALTNYRLGDPLSPADRERLVQAVRQRLA
ncbi:MAG: hypothetical protein RMN53_11835 [Anaerolineae bacterium]|nr:hypothetical protein [Anaerolineae bacterium]